MAAAKFPLLRSFNAAGLCAAAGFAVFGLVSPASAARGSAARASAAETDPTEFWAMSSAVRSWAVAAPALINLLVRPHSASRELLLVAGLVQLGDAAIGLRQHNAAMAVGPAVMAGVHLLSAARPGASNVPRPSKRSARRRTPLS